MNNGNFGRLFNDDISSIENSGACEYASAFSIAQRLSLELLSNPSIL